MQTPASWGLKRVYRFFSELSKQKRYMQRSMAYHALRKFRHTGLVKLFPIFGRVEANVKRNEILNKYVIPYSFIRALGKWQHYTKLVAPHKCDLLMMQVWGTGSNHLVSLLQIIFFSGTMIIFLHVKLYIFVNMWSQVSANLVIYSSFLPCTYPQSANGFVSSGTIALWTLYKKVDTSFSPHINLIKWNM